MDISVETSLLAAMRDNAELTAIVPRHCITNEAPTVDIVLPSISLMMVSGTSQATAGYNNATVKRRDNVEAWQASVFSATKLQARMITAILDRLFIPAVAGIVLVKRTNDADTYEQTPGRWHMPLRYQGEYQVTDT